MPTAKTLDRLGMIHMLDRRKRALEESGTPGQRAFELAALDQLAEFVKACANTADRLHPTIGYLGALRLDHDSALLATTEEHIAHLRELAAALREVAGGEDYKAPAWD